MKKSTKKLTLSKITISNLNSLEMDKKIGGEGLSSIITCEKTRCPCTSTRYFCTLG